jgi:hypothetical protein
LSKPRQARTADLKWSKSMRKQDATITDDLRV